MADTSFVIGDYTYTPDTNYYQSAHTTSAGSSWTATFDYVPIYTDRYGEGDAWARWIYLDVFDDDERTGAFEYGTASSGYIGSMYYSYNGANSVTVRAGGVRTTWTIYFDYLPTGEGVICQATSKTKTSYGAIPSSVTDPNTGETFAVTNLSNCFENCTALVTPPAVPSSVKYMNSTYSGCTNLASAPEIPSAVLYMNSCFSGCSSLSGNIVVNNTPSSTPLSMFYGTASNIYIIDESASGSSIWGYVARSYTNVHYEANDNPVPSLSSLTAIRVGSSGSTTPAEQGMYAYLEAVINVYSTYLPVGWTNGFKSATTTEDGTTITPTWQPATISSYPATIKAWVGLTDLVGHTFTLSISDSINDGSTEVKSNTSATLSVSLAKAYALVSYYHDPNTDTEGFAVGKFAEYADLFDVAMDAIFRNASTFESTAQFDGTATFGSDIYIDLSDYQTTGSVDKELYDAIVALGWDSDVLIS